MPAQAQIPELAQSPSFEVLGSVNWTVRYGLGDPRGLAQKGYSRGFFFNENITLDADVSVAVERPVPGLLSLLAQIDNQQPEFLQSLSILFEAERWRAQFGDFPMGRPESPFASSDRLLKGFKVDWQVNERLSLSAVLSQVSGILQTKTFRGNTVEETVQFVPHPPDRPWAAMPYLCELQGSETYCNLRGLAHFFLGPDFVEGFTKIKLRFPTDERLRELLEAYDLGYLFDVIKEDPEPELDTSYYLIIPAEEGFYLALRTDFETLLRDQIFGYIDDYNLGLPPDAELQEYPLSQGTDYERGFLKRLEELLTITVDSQEFRPQNAAYQRFYYLRHPDILEGSVRVEIRLLEDEEFRPIDDPLLAGFEMNVYPEVGVLELIAPEEFFQNPESAVRVSYAYKTGTGTYVLGLSVLKGSERVYLNGKLLQPGQDYLLEYETGFLILFVEVGPDDVLRIEYEVARGGLGGFAEYRRGFEGLTLQYEPWEGFTLFVDLLRAHDSPTAGVDPESLATMPNNHVVLGLSGVWEGDGFRTDFDLGFNVNVFPPDDNMKINQPNRIYAVHTLKHQGRELVLFGHRNGVQVYDVATGSWSGYGPAEGLAGLEVFDIDSAEGLVAFATSGGLSLLELEPGDPIASFARPADWRRFDERDGLPSSRVLSVLLQNNTVWVGTDKGLAVAPLGDFEKLTERRTWTLYQKEKHPELPSDRVEELAWAGGLLYIGTNEGLVVFNPSAERFTPIAELQGLEIRDLATDGNRVYVATDLGVYAVEGTRAVGRPFLRVAQAVAFWNGEVWAGTEEGLFGALSGLVSETEGRSITALGAGERALWAGEEADREYRLRLFEIAQPPPEGDEEIESGLRVRVYDAREAELDGEAKGRFSNIPAAEHTDLGWVGRISLTKKLGPLTLQGSLRSISPEFTPIGLLNREDRLQLSLGASYALSEALSVHVNHDEGLTDLFRSPTQVLRDSLGLSFRPKGGPTLDVDYTLDRLDHSFERPGFDNRRRSYTLSLGQTLFDQRLDLGLNARFAQDEDPRRPGGGFLEGDVQGTARFQATPNLLLNLALKQPLQLRFGRLFGAGQLSWGADWKTSASLAQLPLLEVPLQLSFQTGYQGSSRLPVLGAGAGGRFSLDQSVNVQVQSTRLQLGEVGLSPQGTFSVRSRDPFSFNSLLELGGDTTVQGQWGLIDGTLSLGRTFSTQGRTGLVRIQDRGRLSLSHRDLGGLRPTLELSGSLETLLHPFFGRIRNGQYQIALQLFWQKLDSPLTADLYLSRQAILTERERTVSYSFQQGIEYQVLEEWGLTPRLDVLLDYTKGERNRQPVEELSGEVTLSAGFTPIPEWTATVGLSYLFTTDATKPRPPAHSFAITVQFGRTFQFF